FKLINDSLGHRAGDELLREAAQRLSHAVRAVDTTARLGGDEFVILLGGPVTEAEAVEIGKRAIQLMEPAMRLLGIDVHISPSIGVAFFPRDGATVDTLIARADAAMYSAKERGRNNVQCYADGMSSVTQERVKLESDLHEALRSGQFELHYQPEVELTESAVMSDAEESIRILEAISRMGVLVSVDDFGTGYSSMSYLRRFPIDKLKIDRCFVEDMTRRPEDASIVRAIISLAHSL